ncbi:MAG: hypothetical protein US74_C0001G0010 [Parcubacteria group bacterium GW2011_GWA2_38_13]|nr:MAG: hypothetical protein US74_C0001G0010 [Parcubacteria group bacterium GW2011_GWA2_38_13]
MKNIRIIPRLDIKGPNLIKGIHTEGLRVLGNPKEFAKRYYEEGADEIIYLDTVASLYQRNLDFDLLKTVAEQISIPLTVGGGIRSIHDINNALRAGADKVAINTYAVSHPEFLAEGAKKFGSQCIVLYIEAKKIMPGKWEVYTDGGRERTGLDVIEWAKKTIDLGVGEILITSVDFDGTRKGFDTDLVSAITGFAPIPVIAHGGAGDFISVKNIITQGHADAVAISSVLHYKDYSLKDLKKYLNTENINVRAVC